MKVEHIVMGLMLATTPMMGAAQTRGIHYDCDTAPGHFSQLALPVPSNGATITGKLKLNQIAKDDEWAPIARLSIAEAAAPGRLPDDLAGFVLTVLPAAKIGLKSKDKDAVAQYLVWHESHDGKATAHMPFGLTDASPTYDFQLRFDGKSVTTSVGGEKTSMTIAAPHPVLHIVCSTGDFLISDLLISEAK